MSWCHHEMLSVTMQQSKQCKTFSAWKKQTWLSLPLHQSTIVSLIQGAPNPKTWMFLILSCSCLCPIHWSQVLSREWRCSWSSADRQCSSYIWVINNFIAYYGVSFIRGLTVGVVTYTFRTDQTVNEMVSTTRHTGIPKGIHKKISLSDFYKSCHSIQLCCIIH